jgi:hypothetical protein
MDQMKRLAVYYAPRPGAFADHAAAWLGWDAVQGKDLTQPDLPEIPFPAIRLSRHAQGTIPVGRGHQPGCGR